VCHGDLLALLALTLL